MNTQTSLLTKWSLMLLLLAAVLTGCDWQSGSVDETVAGDWITIYFTDPQYPDEGATPNALDADLVALIESAQQTIDVAAYELNLESVTDALIAAQDDGLQVRLVTDGSNTDEESIARLEEAGVPVVARPEGWGIMHDKFVVVDGMWVWTGSWNLTYNGTYRNNNNAVMLASRAVAEDYEREFAEMFAGQFGPSSPADTPYPLVSIEGQERTVEVEVYFSPDDGVRQQLLDLLATAQSNVRFMAYQFTNQELADALIELSDRGVTVQGVLEERSISSEYSQFGYLAAGGVDVWADDNPYIMHHKVFIVDDQVVVLGSYNFSGNAEDDNDENVLIVHDSRVAQAFMAEFGRVLQEAQLTAP